MASAKRTSRTALRKRPRQERSEATVDAILEAAARVFATEGYDAATTNRIAEAAGISVGSLYQYFPSKDAIAVDLVRRFRANRIAFVRTQLDSMGHKPVASIIRALFTSFLQADGIRPELYRVLIEQVLRTSARNELRGYEERLEALVADALRRVKPAPQVEDIDLAAFMLVRLVPRRR
jgi:AcrR family transcriptional regulator